MEKGQAQIIVEKSVIEGFACLASALQWLWPTGLSGDKRYFLPIQKRNIFTYISAQFLKKGFLIFNEIFMKNDSNFGFIDIIALNHESGIEIYIEAKDSFNATTGSILQLTNDINRMLSFHGKLVQEHLFASNYTEEIFKHKFALVITSCFGEQIRKWWEDGEITMPENNRAEGWVELYKLLCKAKSRWSVPLKISRGSPCEIPIVVYGLYAIFERED